MGFNVGFDFKCWPYSCDRAEIDDFMALKGGRIYQSGGGPGAEMFVIFKNISSREDADRELPGLVPDLHRFMLKTIGRPEADPGKAIR